MNVTGLGEISPFGRKKLFWAYFFNQRSPNYVLVHDFLNSPYFTLLNTPMAAVVSIPYILNINFLGRNPYLALWAIFEPKSVDFFIQLLVTLSGVGGWGANKKPVVALICRK
jgi:hypothetical protein